MAGDPSNVLELIQKKLAEKDELIREYQKQLVIMEDELSTAKARAEELEGQLGELVQVRSEYDALRKQLETLLG